MTTGVRGQLRVYLGAAPGVGKTFAMLDEGRRRAERGTDVVVAFVETHGRRHTAEQLVGLEMVPRRIVGHRGGRFEEMDLDGVLARRPRLALVDELAHTNVPGSRHAKRWQDVEDLLVAGIDVLSTVNVQHLESLNDVVEKITGVPQRERVPDGFVRAADQVELVDMTPEALRRRLAHGNVYAPEKIDAALGNYFRPGNLTALRELALLWVADKVDEALQHYRTDHEIGDTWEARERVVVALSGGPEGETLVRRAARVAARAARGDLLAVHVTRSDGLVGASPVELTAQRRVVESLGGSYHQVLGDDVPEALLAFARAENATQLVLGVSRRSRLRALVTGRGIGSTTIRGSGDIDVHIVTHSGSGRGRRPPAPAASLDRSRRLRGLALAVVLPLLLTVLLSYDRGTFNLVSDVLLFLLAVVVVALVGGLLPALLAAVGGSLLLNYFFTTPLHRFTINERNNALALGVFVVVALLVSSVVDQAARRTRQAVRAAAEAETLATLASGLVRGEAELPALLHRVREAFGLRGVTLLERGGPAAWSVVAGVGEAVETPAEADAVLPCGDTLSLALTGGPLRAEDQRVVQAFASHAAALLERLRLAATAREAGSLAAANRMRTALLDAVGHDFRTPLAAAKAVVTSLLSRDVELAEGDRLELLVTADEALDWLTALVDNLLDMSRLQAGAMDLARRPTDIAEVVARSLSDLGGEGLRVSLDLPDDLPRVLADPGLLERVVVNLLSNAVRHSPPDRPARLTGSSLGGTVEIRVVDRGPGIPVEDQERVFAPFQRLGDTQNGVGIGLGLALSRGLVEAMSGSLHPEDTPGGGLTMVVALAATDEVEHLEPGLREREGWT